MDLIPWSLARIPKLSDGEWLPKVTEQSHRLQDFEWTAVSCNMIAAAREQFLAPKFKTFVVHTILGGMLRVCKRGEKSLLMGWKCVFGIIHVANIHRWNLQAPNCWCRYVQAELVHSRFAMTAVAGILLPGVNNSSNYDTKHCKTIC